MHKLTFDRPLARTLAGIPLALVLACFMLPFLTLSVQSCSGDNLAATKLTGADLLRDRQPSVQASTDGSAADMNKVTAAAHALHTPALVTFGIAVLALLTALAPTTAWSRLTVAGTIASLWAQLILTASVPSGIVVARESGLWLAMLLCIAATIVASIIAYHSRAHPPGDVTLASFGRRSLGWLLDAMLILVLLLFSGAALSALDAPGALIALILAGLAIVYRAAQECSSQQATIGARCGGMRVVRDNGRRLGVGQALLRATCEVSSFVLLLGMGHLMATFNSDRRALHDVMAGTIVIATPRAVAQTQPADAAAGV
jgi:uncharacterized RDD family membrane protein YckC